MTIPELIAQKMDERKYLLETDTMVARYVELDGQITLLETARQLLTDAEEEQRQAAARKASRRKTKKELEEEFVTRAEDLPDLPTDSEDGQSLAADE